MRLETQNSESSKELIVSHLDFVIAIAKKAKSRFPCVELDDLIQAGNLGLTKAAKNFDRHKADKRGAKFSTYAYFWIKKYLIQEFLKTKYKLHVPEKELRKISYKKKICNSLKQQLGREPSFDEIAKEISLEMKKSEYEGRQILKNIGMSDAQIYSLDRKIRDDSIVTFADIIADPHRIEQTLDDLVLPKMVQKIISSLGVREKRVLEARFGIGTARETSLEELGREFKITRERIRQLEARALRKLKHPSRSRKLKQYWDTS
ncbi:RNA polymerase sigma factor RpoD [subsurface metagenome]